MKPEQQQKKLESFIVSELENSREFLIIDLNNTYQVFGKYYITKRQNYYQVEIPNQKIIDFGSLRHAVSWCIADKNKQWNLADSINRLDETRQIIKQDLATRTAMLTRITDPDQKSIVQMKIANKHRNLHDVETRLGNCVNLAKYWQLKGFNNETARPGRTTAQR